MRRAWLLIITVLMISSLTPLCYALDVDLTDFPHQVADYFGISEFASKYLVSGVGLVFVTMLVGVVMKRSANQAILYAVLIADFVMMAFFVGLGWIDYWVFLIVCLLVALMMAGALRNVITGA